MSLFGTGELKGPIAAQSEAEVASEQERAMKLDLMQRTRMPPKELLVQSHIPKLTSLRLGCAVLAVTHPLQGTHLSTHE